MKLYCNRTSPFARKIRVLAHELQLSEQIEEVLVDPFDASSELLAVNPLSRVPVLVTDEGLCLPDSKLIAEYLLAQPAAGAAGAASGREYWESRRRQQLAEGVIEAAVASVLEKRRPESIVYTAFLDRQHAAAARALDVLAAEAAAFDTDSPGMPEITLGVALAYLDFRLPYWEWRQQHEALASWYEAFAQRPSMRDTAPPG